MGDYSQIVADFTDKENQLSDKFLNWASQSIGSTAEDICQDIEFYQSDPLKAQMMHKMMSLIRDEPIMQKAATLKSQPSLSR